MPRERRKPAEDLEPPAGLSEKSCRIWKELVPARGVSPGRLILLAVALRALDRADQAAEIVEREGMVTVTKTTGLSHAHPALKVERDARQQFLQAWSKLSLAWDVEADGGMTPWPGNG